MSDTTPSSVDLAGIFITLHIDGEQRLFIMSAADGTLNRMGTGSEDCDEKSLYIGKSEPSVFEKLRACAQPVLDSWLGGYSSNEQVGKPCKLTIGFSTVDGQEAVSGWEYGSESQGPPPEVARLVIESVSATNDWYDEQKALSDK